MTTPLVRLEVQAVCSRTASIGDVLLSAMPDDGSEVPTGDLLSGLLNRLNAILSLLQPLDRYRTPSAIGNAWAETKG